MAPIPWVLSVSQSLIMAVATGVSIRKDDVDQLILFRFPAPPIPCAGNGSGAEALQPA